MILPVYNIIALLLLLYTPSLTIVFIAVTLIFASTHAVNPTSETYRISRDTSQENNVVEASNRLNTLRQVNLVIRHGQRSPQSTYPNDPYKDDPMEPYGWGQLTSDGRLSQYNQGLFLRSRYGSFLGKQTDGVHFKKEMYDKDRTKYSPELFWLQSTAADRAKMSALLEAAALWKPNSEQIFLSGLDWQPTILNYQTSDKDNLLLIWSTCPDYARMKDAVLKSPEIQAINEANKNLYQVLSNYSGLLISNPNDVFDLFGTLEAERTMNYTLPSWTNKFFPEAMRALSSLSLKMNVYNETLLKMKAAPLITKIAKNMLDKFQGKLEPEKRKMFMYVGHDSTVVNLLEGMNVWDMQLPNYSIMAMIELHENELGHNVQIYLRNTTQHKPYPLTIPGCDFACPLNKFVQLLSPMIITDEQWKKVCTLKDPNYIPGTEPLP